MSKLQQAIERVEQAFIPYIMAGDGGLDQLELTILKLQQLGATAIEVGIPFTDPVADGPTIEAAGMRALANGTNLTNVLQTLEAFTDKVHIPLIIMTYLNPILAYGAERFAKDATAAGVRGVIVPDMPLEESDIVHDAFKQQQLDLVQLVSLTSPAERIAKLASASEGFVYAVTVNGITGARSSFTNNLEQHFAQLKSVSNVPVLAGFGISTPAHIQQFKAYSDGVIVGSKIVDCLTHNDWDTVEQLIQTTKTVEVK